MSGHTPGPWTVKYGFNIFGPDRNYHKADRLVAGTGGHQNNTFHAAVDAENAANTALIAAAPELLDALEQCPLLPSVVDLPDDQKQSRVLRWADEFFQWQDGKRAAAIAKAEGR